MSWEKQFQNCIEQRDQARNELAALREELERVKAQSAQRLGGLAACGIKREAAEQRNAELVELLTELRNNPHTFISHYCERIDAALKPTESGASE